MLFKFGFEGASVSVILPLLQLVGWCQGMLKGWGLNVVLVVQESLRCSHSCSWVVWCIGTLRGWGLNIVFGVANVNEATTSNAVVIWDMN
jgi:hypothetical protein